MTKLEKLARDCIENHTHRLIDKPTKQDIYLREESIYIQGYRECERRDKKRIADLEAQIEKMKCCENCNNFMHRIDHRCNTKCKNLSEWEIKEK